MNKFIIKLKSSNIKIKNIILLIISGIINATGVVLILSPSGVYDGGFSGTSMLISSYTGLNISIFLAVLNLPFFILGFRKLGLQFVIYSVISISSYTLMSALYTYLDIAHIVYELMSNQMLLASIFGGMISGIGSGLTIRYGGAIDGVEVLSLLCAKRIGLTIGQFNMAYNIIIYSVASGLAGSLTVGMYSIISYTIGLKVVDFIVDGLDKGKAFIVITDNGELVANNISKNMKIGVTVLDSKGYYSDTHKTMLYCVVNRFDIVRLKNLIKNVDPEAFISINEVSEVVGNKHKRYK